VNTRHDPRTAPARASTSPRYCEECGQITVWYLTLSSAVPGFAGTAYQWICTGQPAVPEHSDQR
jgi:hypothetical protein